MSVANYGKAIALIAEAHEATPDVPANELARYFMSMAINALTDCMNSSLGFIEPERLSCKCDKCDEPRRDDDNLVTASLFPQSGNDRPN
jgi:hypothetical protein